MKKRKGILALFLAVIVVAAIVGIAQIRGHQSKNTKKGNGSVYCAEYAVGTFAEQGMFYNEDGLLVFQDAKTNENGYVCKKANCEHISYKNDENTECDASLEEFSFVCMNDEGLYIIGRLNNEEMTNLEIYSAKKDGSGRKKLLEIPNSIFGCRIYYKVKYNNQYIVMGYKDSYRMDEETGELVPLEQPVYGHTVYSIEENKLYETEISNDQLSQISANTDFSLTKNKFIVSYFGYDDSYDEGKAQKLKSEKAQEYSAEHILTEIDTYEIGSGRITARQSLKGVENVRIDGSQMIYANDEGLYYAKDCSVDAAGTKIDSATEKNITVQGIAQDNLIYSAYDEDSGDSSCCILDWKKNIKNSVPLEKETSILGNSDDYIWLMNGTERKAYSIEALLNGEISGDALLFGEEENDRTGEQKEGKKEDGTLVWACSVPESYLPDKQTVTKINKQIKQEGCDFKVKFVSYFDEKGDYETAIRKLDGSVDLLSMPGMSAGENYNYDLVSDGLFWDFTKKIRKIAPDVWKTIPKDVWKCACLEGKYYFVPNTAVSYGGAYYAFNKKYFTEKELQNFDATLSSLDALVQKKTSGVTLENDIILSQTLTDYHFGTFVDGDYYNGMFYPEDGSDITPWFLSESVRKFYQQLNNWYKNGYIGEDMSFVSGDQSSLDKVFADIRSGSFFVLLGNGITDSGLNTDEVIIKYAPYRRFNNISCSTAIYQSSGMKAESLQLLNLLYQNRELADLLCYGANQSNYTKEKGVFLVGDDYGDIENRRFSFGLQIVTTPMQEDGVTDYQRQLKGYFKQTGQKYDSQYLGFIPELSGNEDAVKKLVSLEEADEAQNIWRSDDFETDYDILAEQVNLSEYRNISSALNKKSSSEK